MTSESRTALPAPRWAPWWVYVLVIVPANLGKERLIGDAHWSLRAALTATIIVAAVLLVTAIYRGRRS
jgi:hypothetical protein